MKSVGTRVTGAVEHMNAISRNGGISMGCVALVFQIRRTLMKSHQLRFGLLSLFMQKMLIYEKPLRDGVVVSTLVLA